ncbi:MAG TPA: hypothetical protein VKN18_29345 [Blastocatellia bacterium]|nr:hypothetical protein [Blastocatellia bacterium]
MIAVICHVINEIQKNNVFQQPFGTEMIDLMEEMLFQRAASGIRPVLYLSSYTDLECSMLMLLDDSGEARFSAEQLPVERQPGYHTITN